MKIRRFCASKKGGIRGGGRVSAWGAVAGCRKALVGTGWTISYLVSTNRLRNPPLPCRGTIFGLVGRIQSGGVLAGRRTLTIESSLMSGCGWGHEPKEIVSKNL